MGTFRANAFEFQHKENAPRRRASLSNLQTVSWFPREIRRRYAAPKSNAFTLWERCFNVDSSNFLQYFPKFIPYFNHYEGIASAICQQIMID